MELRHLETFRAVATTMSFSRAGELLTYAQSTVSTHVADLERHLGVRLFDRIGRTIALTDAGRRVLPYAERILDLAASARQVAATELPAGPVVISAPETILAYRLPPALQAVRRRFPDVAVRIRTGPYARILHDLEQASIDVAFLLQEPLATGHLHVHAFGREELVAVAAPDHPLVENLAPGHEFTALLTERGCGYRHLFQHRLARTGLQPSQTIELESVDAIKKCVEAGVGVGYLPLVAVQAEVDAGQLVAIEGFGPPAAVIFQMVYHPDRWLSPATEAFMGVCRVTLGEERRPGAQRRVPTADGSLA